MEKTIPQKIISLLTPVAQGLSVADVRIGVIYTSVRLDSGNTGIAWTAQRQAGACFHQESAGTLAGRPAAELLKLLVAKDSPLSRTIGLATANALTSGMPRPQNVVSDEILGLIAVQPSERVAMVGFFGPLIPRLRHIGCRLEIQELNSDKAGAMTVAEKRSSLQACDVAIITATSVVTATLDQLLSDLGKPRAAVILGPSSFMRPEVFHSTPITHIAGARVRDAAALERVISEAGGTKTLKHFMDFETLCLTP